MADALDFGSLTPILQRTAGRGISNSAGPISDAFTLSTAEVAAIVGPQGSGKTTASVKKAIVEAMRIWPDEHGHRRYVLGTWRQKYQNLWSTTLPSWWKLLPKDLGTFNGSSPRAAEHIIPFEDGYGPITLVARFMAFGDVADPEDLKGHEFTDVWLNEIDTLPEELFEMLVGRVGRDPPREMIRRGGRIFGDMNAPDVLNWCYRDFFEDLKPGYELFRQPGGLEAGAENLAAVGRGYYEQQARLNAHRQWWIRRMIHNKPGFTRDLALVYPEYDDDRHLSPREIEPVRELPVLIGIDGGLTPAAVFCQEMSDGQLRVLAEIAFERSSETGMAQAINALIARRFRGCEFVVTCDPAMGAGEDTPDGSARWRLEKALGMPVKLASTNMTDARWSAVRDKLILSLDAGRPGFLLDPSCKGLRRGFNQTYHFRAFKGSNELSTVEKSFDSHVHDGLQYVALLCGSAVARQRRTDLEAERRIKRQAARGDGQRYSPLRRGR
jgi:hypothetical protein